MYLVLDTCQSAAHLAIMEQHSIRASVSELNMALQAEKLPALLNQVLHDAGTTLQKLNHIVVVIGPGSFTGIRIGLAYIQGLQIATQIPTSTLTFFEAMAQRLATESVNGIVDCVVPSARDLYVQRFTLASGLATAQTEPAILDLSQLAPETSVPLYIQHTKDTTRAATLLEMRKPQILPLTFEDICMASAALNKTPNHAPLVPLYLSVPDAKPQGTPICAA